MSQFGEKERGAIRAKFMAKGRAKTALFLCREMGISMAEIARNLGVGTSAIAMAIRKGEREKVN
ncbi:MAG: hypothetical protein V2A69_09270 [Pseudomonadota bacterium]